MKTISTRNQVLGNVSVAEVIIAGNVPAKEKLASLELEMFAVATNGKFSILNPDLNPDLTKKTDNGKKQAAEQARTF